MVSSHSLPKPCWSYPCFCGGGSKKPWEQEACTELYNSIELFVGLADKEWKKENAERASFFASVAADYSIIYQTVCRGKKK